MFFFSDGFVEYVSAQVIVNTKGKYHRRKRQILETQHSAKRIICKNIRDATFRKENMQEQNSLCHLPVLHREQIKHLSDNSVELTKGNETELMQGIASL